MVGCLADAIFEHPRLVAIYDALDPDRSDLDVYAAIADETRTMCCPVTAKRPLSSRKESASTSGQGIKVGGPDDCA